MNAVEIAVWAIFILIFAKLILPLFKSVKKDLNDIKGKKERKPEQKILQGEFKVK